MENPFIGKRVLVRTFSAGVHIGTLVSADGKECYLKDGYRLWQWRDGGLSLSAVATNGVKAGRLNRTAKVVLTECIEFIPVTEKADATFERHVEDAE